MTIILRLQGLDVKAGTEDIRTFFKGLRIPDGGVYIVGGCLKEAFIAFTTERDAQFAMRHTENLLKGSKVILHISSMAELEHKLKSSLKRKKRSHMQPSVKRPSTTTDVDVLPLNAHFLNPNSANLPPPSNPEMKRPSTTTDVDVLPLNAHPLNPNSANLPPPSNPEMKNLQLSNAPSLDSNAAFLLGICTVLQGLQSSLQSENSVALPRVDFPKADDTDVCDEMKQKQTLVSRPGYVRLFGLPASTTKEDICQFFKGLTVQEAIVNVELGRSHACLVKFANVQDACDALHFNQQSLGPISVEVRGATEKMWTAFAVGESVTPKKNPLGGTGNLTEKNTSAMQCKRRAFNNQLPSQSLKKPRRPPTTEYIVMVNNIPNSMTKTEIKELFACPNIAHYNVQHLLDTEGNRTATAFLIFNRTEDYEYAMNLTGCHVGSNAIAVSSITKTMMREMMAKTHHKSLEQCPKTGTETNKPNGKSKSDPLETQEDPPIVNPDPAAKTCLLVRNMPADVQKHCIKKLFRRYRLEEGDITSLYDGEGNGIGEAVVQFRSPKLAALAHKSNGKLFMGTKVLLTLINVTQMEDILAKNVSGN
ncbi:RNA-binding protein 12B [Liparis tanakae]|uniref:RNA-binding protein 12B n=1 Tax=Liparis tanakae TaxID=230148 RepID=A0A4Z2ID69_9TELE|nr:RNA-binding protein 12B [Liparis tanakae]